MQEFCSKSALRLCLLVLFLLGQATGFAHALEHDIQKAAAHLHSPAEPGDDRCSTCHALGEAVVPLTIHVPQFCNPVEHQSAPARDRCVAPHLYYASRAPPRQS